MAAATNARSPATGSAGGVDASAAVNANATATTNAAASCIPANATAAGTNGSTHWLRVRFSNFYQRSCDRCSIDKIKQLEQSICGSDPVPCAANARLPTEHVALKQLRPVVQPGRYIHQWQRAQLQFFPRPRPCCCTQPYSFTVAACTAKDANQSRPRTLSSRKSTCQPRGRSGYVRKYWKLAVCPSLTLHSLRCLN
jgi:hypothetical protein